jgi:hypothetical protein
MAYTRTLTPCPEKFERGSRIGGKGGVETDVVDAGFAPGGGFHPLIASAKDIGCCGAFSFDLGDNGAGFAAGIGVSSLDFAGFETFEIVWQG